MCTKANLVQATFQVHICNFPNTMIQDVFSLYMIWLHDLWACLAGVDVPLVVVIASVWFAETALMSKVRFSLFLLTHTHTHIHTYPIQVSLCLAIYAAILIPFCNSMDTQSAAPAASVGQTLTGKKYEKGKERRRKRVWGNGDADPNVNTHRNTPSTFFHMGILVHAPNAQSQNQGLRRQHETHRVFFNGTQ